MNHSKEINTFTSTKASNMAKMNKKNFKWANVQIILNGKVIDIVPMQYEYNQLKKETPQYNAAVAAASDANKN